MIFNLPIYLEDSRGRCIARPLFRPEIVAKGSTQARALSRLSNDVRKRLEDLVRSPDHEPLGDWSFDPPIRTEVLSTRIEVQKQILPLRILIVTFTALGRQIAYTPSVPDSWTELEGGESASLRIEGLLTRRLKESGKLERQGRTRILEPEDVNRLGRLSVTHIEPRLSAAQSIETQSMDPFALMGGGEKMHGEHELHRAGRGLDDLYPADLKRAVHREDEVTELTRLLTDPERPPVLLVGPRLCGKTTVMHEFVYRKNEASDAPRARRQVWQIAPQRLISGMMYVGQWEERLLVILGEAQRRDHILYFDDLLGLFQAGRSSCSNLTVGDVLKPHLEERQMRIVGEVSPEQLRVLRERDRGFVDQFQIVRIEEPEDERNYRMLLGLVRRMESRFGFTSNQNLIPDVVKLMRDAGSELSRPGRYAQAIERSAPRAIGVFLSQEDVSDEYRARTGLSSWFMPTGAEVVATASRESIEETLRKDIIGQRDAIESVTNTLLVARARIADPDRPLGSFLFLGPTGVGKTQCAKAIAKFLLREDRALLRFDMNEYLSPSSVVRLVGTFERPDGLLTGAVRRHPFSVILFDEIEKADPGVFDLLLQVLGEGRLTDATGSTVNFANTFIVMTSNLGVREAQSRLGFGEQIDVTAYVRAARRFFRPEFFNRIDHIVPFASLADEELQEIAVLQLRQLFARDGIVQRKIAVSIEPLALERIVDEGKQPELGARALRRCIETHIARPVAIELAQQRVDTATVLRIFDDDGTLRTVQQELVDVAPGQTLRSIPADRVDQIVERLRLYLGGLLQGRSDGLSEITLGADRFTPSQQRYLDLRLVTEEVQQRLDEIEHSLETQMSRAPVQTRARAIGAPQRCWAEMCAAYDVAEFWMQLEDRTKAIDLQSRAQLLGFQVERIAVLAACAAGDDDERVLLWVHGLDVERSAEAKRAEQLLALFGPDSRSDEERMHSSPTGFDLATEFVAGTNSRVVLVSGAGARILTAIEHGTIVSFDEDRRMDAVATVVRPLEPDEEAEQVARELRDTRPDDPRRAFPPVLRMIDRPDSILDLRSGIRDDLHPWRLVSSQIALPDDLGLELPSDPAENGDT